MPAQILHSLHGKLTLQAYIAKAEAGGSASCLASAAYMRKLLEDPFYPFFCLGCQGPDLFYHNQRTRPVALEYGSLLHRRGYGDFIEAFLGNCLNTAGTADEPPLAAAYAIGFIMHPFLDRSLHPYIICRTGNASESASAARGIARMHIFLERIIDVLMLEKLENLQVEAWDQEKFLAAPTREGPSELIDILARSLRQTYPERAGRDTLLEERLSNAFKDAGHFYQVTSPAVTCGRRFGATDFFQADEKRGMALTAFLYPERFSREIDFLNERRNGWHHPCESTAVRNESVNDLFLTAVDAASEALAAVFPGKDDQPSASAFSSSIGNTGLSLMDDDGSRCSPRHFDPFPLEGILEEQYRMRISSVGAL